MATDPNATKMMVPTADLGKFEQIKAEMLADLQRTKLNPFEQGILDEVIYGRPRLVPFTVQRHDPYAERSVGARAVQTIKADDHNPRPFFWSGRSGDPASWENSNGASEVILTEEQVQSLRIRPFKIGDLRWGYQTVFKPNLAQEINGMLAAGWCILEQGHKPPERALMVVLDNVSLYRPITPVQIEAVNAALGKPTEADDGPVLKSMSHPPEHPLYAELAAEEAAMAAQLPAPGVFERGRNQASAHDRPPPAGFKRLTAEQKRDLSAQAASDPTIYGFGLAADRGPEGGTVQILPTDTSIRARVVAIDGVSQEQAHQIALLLERIFQADHEGSGRWLREHCGPLGSTPIKALEDGRTEKVIAYLEAAAP